jgi:hypothetical protein
MPATTEVTAQTRSAGRGQSVGGFGNAWANPNNITASDNSRSTIAVAGSAGSDELWADSFNFALNNVVAVCGIRVDMEGNNTFGSTTTFGFRLIKGGVEVGNATAKSLASSSDVILSAGASGDLWGTTFTEAEIEASAFGVSFNVASSIGGANVDHVQITVHYVTELTIAVNRFDSVWEAMSVDTEKVVRPVSHETGWDGGSARLNVFDPENEFSHDFGSPALTGAYNLQATNFERGWEVAGPVFYDPNLRPASAEFGREIEGGRSFLIFNEGVGRAEFDREFGGARLRQLLLGITPPDRTFPAQPASRRLAVPLDNRRVQAGR